MDCSYLRTIHTIGHSTRALDRFLGLLRLHNINLLVDVRRWPSSRRFPHFGREALMTSLAREGIGYVWREDLGGYRRPSPESPNTAWRVGAFRAYADFMLTAAFDQIMEEIQRPAERQHMAIMCSEAVPWRCHRQLLADAFVVRGWSVRHILDDGCEAHRLPPFAHPSGTRILYPAEVGKTQSD